MLNGLTSRLNYENMYDTELELLWRKVLDLQEEIEDLNEALSIAHMIGYYSGRDDAIREMNA